MTTPISLTLQQQVIELQVVRYNSAGPRGLSAYQIAVANGFNGNEAAWLASLQGDAGNDGADGSDGADGLSAYEVAVANGFVGNQAAWLASLKGDKGDTGNDGADGNDGAAGLSAYQVAVSNGFNGNEAAWLASLKGDKGDTGNDGADGNDGAAGLSAYQVAVANGFNGNEAAWLASLKGDQGDPGNDGADGNDGAAGLSAYQVAVANGFVGNEAAWLASLKGDQGDPGNDGANGANGTDGKTVRSGSGAPSAGLGVDGDFYINTATSTIYGPKAGGSWGSGVSLIGPVGPAGANGTNGTNGTNGSDGKTILNGSGVPSGGLGTNGDFYIDTTASRLYGPKTAGAWGSGVSLIGPAGAGSSHASNKFSYRNDYLVINSDSSFGGVNFQNSSSGTGATVTYENSEPGCQGVVRVHTGTTTTGRGNFWHPKGYNAICLGTNGIKMWFKFKLGEAAATVAEDYDYRHGFTQNIAGDGANDIVFLIKRTVNGGNLTIRYRSNSVTRFDLDTTIVPSTSYQEFYFEMDPSTHVITVYNMSGVQLAQSAAPAVKIASTERFAMSENINKLAGTTNRTVYSDHFYMDLT